MIPVKIQCGCGQRYAFDVEPVNGRMATPVACPVCGADGTATANEVIARMLVAQPQVAPSSGLRLSAVAATVAPVVRAPVLPIVTARPPVRPTTTCKRTILISGIVSAVLVASVTYHTLKVDARFSAMVVVINSLIMGAASTGIVALWSWRSQTEWSWWRTILTTVVGYFVAGVGIVVVLSVIARLL